jgi:ribosomal protein L10
MQVEKNIIIDDLMERVNVSPFMLVTDFTGLTVGQFEELRVRLEGVSSKIHVTKNSYIKRVTKALLTALLGRRRLSPVRKMFVALRRC